MTKDYSKAGWIGGSKKYFGVCSYTEGTSLHSKQWLHTPEYYIRNYDTWAALQHWLAPKELTTWSKDYD